ncbi:Pr6Pr family membrane protein [Pseudonocardia kujensis]|uniref:Pr6Pr family membrane protein n=1 Tax=Pseudonocardia kujensis TaxID=1128675 RepID=UPI001E5E7C3E|nr:Pr6Pr family membrane protein [Pseudonocardia kujensis]MCE0762306.1 Pr6Pr family membrane protein [Pseudonocardia kujensis]
MPRYLPLARPWFGLVAAFALLGVVLQVVATAVDPGPYSAFTSTGARVANLFAFFTILSNLLVGIAHVLLAAAPERDSRAMRVLVLDAVVAIAVTGIVYNLVLAQTANPQGLHEVANVLCHMITPLLAVLGWLLFGPRGLVDLDVVLLSAVYPLAWLAFTLARGAVVDWYPYPFVDVVAHGYARVAINCLVVALLFVGLGFGALALDRRLPGLAAG